MSEVLQTTYEVAPFVLTGTALGAAAGVVAEGIIRKKRAEEDVAFNETMGTVNEQIEASSSQSRIGQLAGKLTGGLALTGALVGAVNGYAWAPESPSPTKTVGLQLVVDRSGFTDIAKDNVVPANTIDKVIARFDENNSLSIVAHVAGGSEVQTVKSEEVEAIPPSGDAPMRTAFTRAQENVRLSDDDSVEGSNAIVLLTNGNTFGKAGTVIKDSNKVRSSLFVVNVNDDIKQRSRKTLQKIADRTEGQYWDMSDASVDEIVDKVSNEVNPAPESDSGMKLPIKMIGALMLGYFAYRMRTLRNEPRKAIDIEGDL